ncbi:hypothetical protein [Streptomyces sp. UG1]|uniref:hypothetical protein n=1 Tax=Streptomyces sp. UG1 TaxID=3417652 RepID=UPI003CFAFB68
MSDNAEQQPRTASPSHAAAQLAKAFTTALIPEDAGLGEPAVQAFPGTILPGTDRGRAAGRHAVRALLRHWLRGDPRHGDRRDRRRADPLAQPPDLAAGPPGGHRAAARLGRPGPTWRTAASPPCAG